MICRPYAIISLLCFIHVILSINLPGKRVILNFKGLAMIKQILNEKSFDDELFLYFKNKLKVFTEESNIVSRIKSFYHDISMMSHDITHMLSYQAEDQILHHNFHSSLEEEDKKFFHSISDDNKVALEMFNRLLESKNEWQFVAETDGVVVERRYLSSGPFVSKADAMKGHKHACVKSSAVINATSANVFDLFLNTDRAKEYNEHIATITDLYCEPYTKTSKSWSKVSYATGPRMGPFKARDFCSVVNYIRNNDNSYVILNRPAYFSKAKPNNQYVRATILLAGNIIRPVSDNLTEVTLVAHVNPGGGADTTAAAWFINKLCAVGPPAFIRRLESAANRTA